MLHRAAEAGGEAAAQQSTASAGSPRGSLRAPSTLRGPLRAATPPRASGAVGGPADPAAPGAPPPAAQLASAAQALEYPAALYTDAGLPLQAASWVAPSPRSPSRFAVPALAPAHASEPDLAHNRLSVEARGAPPSPGPAAPGLAHASKQSEAAAAASRAVDKSSEVSWGAAELHASDRQGARVSEALRWRGAKALDVGSGVAQ